MSDNKSEFTESGYKINNDSDVKINVINRIEEDNGKSTSLDKRNESEKGNLSEHVGTGKYARVNIIWYIISSIIIIYSSVLAINVIFSIYGLDASILTQNIKETWNIFTPILTLALGYLFGKEKSKKKKKRRK